MLHRAMLGSMERFIGILLEETGGDLPLWLAPVQIVIINITDNQREYAASVYTELKKYGFRAVLDIRNEKVGFKIREHSMQRVPFLVIVGDREVEAKKISIRTREGKDLGQYDIVEFCKMIK